MNNTIKIINVSVCCIVCEYSIDNKMIAVNTKNYNKTCPNCQNTLLFWEKV